MSLDDLSKTAQKELKKEGVPSDYFNKSSYVSLPRWQENFSFGDLPSYQEGFSSEPLSFWQEGMTWWDGLSKGEQAVIIVAGVVIIVGVICVFGPAGAAGFIFA